jgi:hypothetical protein
LRASLALAALCLGTSCLHFSWSREARYAPIAAAELERLEAERTDLTACLAAFGAPLWVWEQDPASGASAVLAYGWSDARDLGFRFNVPIGRVVSPYVDYHQLDRRMRGLVLFFDADWKLLRWRTGLLRDLTREVRRPPAEVEADS